MEFLETHTGKDAKAVWKNDIDMPVKEEATEESDDEESEDEEDDKSKESTGKKRKRSFLLFLFFYFFFGLRIIKQLCFKFNLL